LPPLRRSLTTLPAPLLLPCAPAEKVLETTQHGSLGLKPIATVIKAISHLSISPEDALLRCQWRSLVARSALVLQIACCKHHDQLDIPMLVTFYESWARAPLYLGLSADNRCTQFRLVEDLRLLTPFKWEGVAPVTITPTEATRLLVAMANVAVRQRTYPSSTCVEFLATRLTACVARLTIAEMEAVAGAVAPLQWPTIPGSGAIRLLGAISEEAVRRMALKEESAVDCAAVLAVAVASAQSNRQRWQAVQLLENIEGWKEQYGEKAAKEHIHAALPAVVRRRSGCRQWQRR